MDSGRTPVQGLVTSHEYETSSRCANEVDVVISLRLTGLSRASHPAGESTCRVVQLPHRPSAARIEDLSPGWDSRCYTCLGTLAKARSRRTAAEGGRRRKSSKIAGISFGADVLLASAPSQLTGPLLGGEAQASDHMSGCVPVRLIAPPSSTAQPVVHGRVFRKFVHAIWREVPGCSLDLRTRPRVTRGTSARDPDLPTMG